MHHDAAIAWLGCTDDLIATCPITQGALIRMLIQVTDTYLAQLARSRAGQLATFDQGLAQLHDDVAHLVPTG